MTRPAATAHLVPQLDGCGGVGQGCAPDGQARVGPADVPDQHHVVPLGLLLLGMEVQTRDPGDTRCEMDAHEGARVKPCVRPSLMSWAREEMYECQGHSRLRLHPRS